MRQKANELKKLLERSHKIGLTKTFVVESERGILYVHHCEHGDEGSDINIYTKKWLDVDWPGDAAIEEDISIARALRIVKRRLGSEFSIATFEG